MISLIILIACLLISIPAFKRSDIFYKYDFNPYAIVSNKEYIRFISHAFLHADGWHLGINMFVLYMFGGATERYFSAYAGSKGVLYFLLLYFGGILFSALPSYKKHQNNPNYHSVGASGAVSAVVFSSVVFSPGTELCLYGLPFLCFPGIVWGIIYIIYSYRKSKQANDHINHDAHLWGAIYGVVFTMLILPETIPSFFAQIIDLLPF